MLLNKVVIGSSLESILYAFSHNAYFLVNNNILPFFFEELQEYKIFGSSNKKEIYEKFQTILGFLGRHLHFEGVETIRIEDNSIKVFDQSLLAEFQFDQCFICDTQNLTFENKIVEPNAATYKVVDDFKVSRIPRGTNDIPTYISKDKLLSKAVFYNSLRVDGAKRVTDVIALSELTKEQLHSVDYSDTMIMFKLRKIMEDMGYKGLVENIKYKNGKNRIKKLIWSTSKELL